MSLGCDTNLYVNEVNERANVKKYFNTHFNKYINENKDDISRYNTIPVWVQDIISESSIFLDAGCGSGIKSKVFKKYFDLDNTIGFDISDEMCFKAKKESCIDNVIQCDIMNLPFREKTIDIIYTNCVFHHIVSNSRRESKELVKKVIKNFLKIINKNGYIYIREIYYESYLDELLTNKIIFSVLYTMKKIKEIFNNRNYLLVNFFSRKELENVIHVSGAKIVKKTFYSRKIKLHERVALTKEKGSMWHLITS